MGRHGHLLALLMCLAHMCTQHAAASVGQLHPAAFAWLKVPGKHALQDRVRDPAILIGRQASSQLSPAGGNPPPRSGVLQKTCHTAGCWMCWSNTLSQPASKTKPPRSSNTACCRCWSPTPCWRPLATPRPPAMTIPRASESLQRSHLTRRGESQGQPSQPTSWNARGWCQSAHLSARTTSSTSCAQEPQMTRRSSLGESCTA